MNRVLVTGAGGFLGQAVLSSIPDCVEVIALFGPEDDLKLGGEIPACRNEVEIEVGDITDSILINRICKGVDTVIHLAGMASVAQSFKKPIDTLRGHVLGAGVLADAVAKGDACRIIHISSAEVYGRPKVNPVGEGAITAPRSPYAAAKLGAENVFYAASISANLEVVILRPFSIYGPGQRQTSLLHRIVSQAIEGVPVELFNLSPVRDFVYVADVVKALWGVARTERSFDKTEIYNVATGNGTKIADLAAMVLALVGRREESIRQTGSDRELRADISQLVGCTNKFSKLINGFPYTDLATGLQETVEFYRNVRLL